MSKQRRLSMLPMSCPGPPSPADYRGERLDNGARSDHGPLDFSRGPQVTKKPRKLSPCAVKNDFADLDSEQSRETRPANIAGLSARRAYVSDYRAVVATGPYLCFGCWPIWPNGVGSLHQFLILQRSREGLRPFAAFKFGRSADIISSTTPKGLVVCDGGHVNLRLRPEGSRRPSRFMPQLSLSART
jgi:hypothetical protein